MARVRVLCGTHRSDREARIHEALGENWLNSALVVPRRSLVYPRSERLIRELNLRGTWGRSVFSFLDFAVEILREEGLPVSMINDTERALVVEQAVEKARSAGVLKSIGPSADTPGFTNQMLRGITQLKQGAVEPPAFRKALARKQTPTELDAALAAVYEHYQQALIAAGAYDEVGLYWRARTLCEQRAPRALKRLGLVTFDGFDDFTNSEFGVIEAAAQHVNELVFGFNAVPDDPSRSDLDALPLATMKRIQDRFELVERAQCDEQPPESYVDWAAAKLFWRDPPSSPQALRGNIALMPCRDAVEEIEQIGRQVKRLIREEQVAPDDIAVVFRRLGANARIVRDVFAEFGIPLRCSQPAALAEHAAAIFLVESLQALEEWRRDDVVDALMSPWLRPQEGGEGAFPLQARAAGIVSGQREWQSRLTRLMEKLQSSTYDDMERVRRRVPEPLAAVQSMQSRLAALQAMEKQWPKRATRKTFAAALDSIIDMLLESFGDGDFTLKQYDLDAIAALRALLCRVHLWSDADQRRLSRAQFLTALRSAFEATAVPGIEQRSGVRCLEADRARHYTFAYVFLAGLNEGEFPCPPPGSAIYSDDDIREFAGLGVPFDDKRKHGERERLAFAQVVATARTVLTLSWRQVSGDDRPLLPSPFVAHVRELFPGIEPRPALNGVAPGLDELASVRDLRNATFLAGGELRRAFATQFGAAEHGATIESSRQFKERFDAYDGVLAEAAHLTALAERFGPAHVFSANQLERYARCPFQFLMERLLAIEEVPAPAEAVERMERGRLLHAVLQSFHAQFREQPVALIEVQAAESAMRGILERVLADNAGRLSIVPDGMVAMERERLWMLLRRYLVVERGRGETQWRPSHFEVAFGAQPSDSVDALSQTEPFPLATEDGDVLFAGRIDRVDRCDDGARVIDYKTSISATKADIDEGRSLQLSIYVLTLQEMLLKDSPCLAAYFVKVGDNKRLDGMRDAEWPEREAILRDAVARYVRDIRAGKFPPTPAREACMECRHRRACRYEKARIERKVEAASP